MVLGAIAAESNLPARAEQLAVDQEKVAYVVLA